MNKLLIGLILIFASTSVIADWDKVGYSTNFDTYANIKSIRTSGNIVKMWTLYDFKTPQNFNGDRQYQSWKLLEEYDCGDDRSNVLARIYFDGPMGLGEVVYSSEEITKWTHVVPESVSASLMNVACGKKSIVSSDFDKYSITTKHEGKAAPVILNTTQAKNYKTRLKEASKQPANFAGEYVLASWGCGMDCVYGAVVSLKTGNVVFLPATVCCWFGQEKKLQYQLDNRILILNGTLNEGEHYGQFFYEFNGQKFKLIHKVPIDKEMHISKSNE